MTIYVFIDFVVHALVNQSYDSQLALEKISGINIPHLVNSITAEHYRALTDQTREQIETNIVQLDVLTRDLTQKIRATKAKTKLLRELRIADMKAEYGDHKLEIEAEKHRALKQHAHEEAIMIADMADKKEAIIHAARQQERESLMRTAARVENDQNSSPLKHSQPMRHP
jgi:hypothetical protein